MFEKGKLENSYHLLRIGDRDWIILVLEFGPRDAVVAWANRVLERYPKRLGILVTHAYLFRGNTRYDHLRGSQRASPHGWGNDGEASYATYRRTLEEINASLPPDAPRAKVAVIGIGWDSSQTGFRKLFNDIMPLPWAISRRAPWWRTPS